MSIECRLSLHHYAAHEAQSRHEHDHVQVSVVLRGGVRESVGSAEQDGTPLNVVLKGAGLWHANRFGPQGATMLQVAFPLEALDAVLDVPPRTAHWRWLHDPAAAAPFLRLLRAMRGATGTLPIDDPDLTDLLARITGRPAAVLGHAPAWLLRVRERLLYEWQPGMTVKTLAAEAEVHPVYLARVMRRWFGTGVAEELRRARVRAAAKEITSAGMTMSRVAHALGYADEAHLCRDFGRTAGMTPARYRRLVAPIGT